jgi:tRNA pseudouridine32 synthase/23S rRNA pseudouridine746 synthase
LKQAVKFDDFMKNSTHFIPFKTDVTQIDLPEKFTFPFYYEPHPISKIAAEELQEYLKTQTDWKHNFGFDANEIDPIGKMFGVLVVQKQSGELGYLAAFSGKLANSNHHPYFVPPVFDILRKDGFYKLEEEFVNEVNRKLEKAEQNPALFDARKALKTVELEAEQSISDIKKKIQLRKKNRSEKRKLAREKLDSEAVELVELYLSKESMQEQYFLKDLQKQWKLKLTEAHACCEKEEAKIQALREERKLLSSALQVKIFNHYSFLNHRGEEKSLLQLFDFLAPLYPPAGAGECAAPKLMQFAYLNQLKPIALAEFWWGISPNSEVRKHLNYYPACRGKCEPILSHMLEGLVVDENPMLNNPAAGKEIEIVFEDEYIAVIYKPEEFLSVPGITILDSVYERVKKKYPEATGPLVVHRLDMSTSGLMLIAKTKEIHKSLQRLFIKRTIKKKYIALLDGEITEESGIIDLPLRVDLDDRPRQMVCFEHGKTARTKWEVIERKNGKTRVAFYPITGRTHQLRVHAAHPLGLNTPIVGDDLYGKKSTRLHLHAAQLDFKHPVSGALISVEREAGF